MIVSTVIEQHAADAAFLWIQRSHAVSQPHYALSDLAKLDDRLEAHVDGLRIAGVTGRSTFSELAEPTEPGAMFVATVLALESGGGRWLEELVERASAERDLSRAVVSAFGWIPFARGQACARDLMARVSPTTRRIGIAALTCHRADPGPELELAVRHEDPHLCSRALRALGELGKVELAPLAETYLISADTELRSAAGWAVTLLSPGPDALRTLAAIAVSGGPGCIRANQAVMRGAEYTAAKEWHRKLAHDPVNRTLAIQGAGAIGDPGEIPWLIEQMEIPELARVAGESFATITGVDLAYQDLEGERPKGFESGPTEDPEDENVDMDPDENLPWPDPSLIQKWWMSNRHAFQPGTRYLLGKPITVDWCKRVLRIGRQRQRAAAALELAMRQPGTPLFEVRAPGFRQQRMLGL